MEVMEAMEATVDMEGTEVDTMITCLEDLETMEVGTTNTFLFL